jgi:Apea-like HEPN
MSAKEPDSRPIGGSAPELPREQLLSALGDDFLAYVCALDPADIEQVRHGTRVLDDARRSVFESVLRLAAQFSTWRRPNASNDDFVPPPGREYEPLLGSFGRFFVLTEAGITVADSLRQIAGGRIRALPDGQPDALRHALHWLARDIWPYLLLPADETYRSAFPFSGVSVASFDHPAQAALMEATQKEREPMRLLFPSIPHELADSVRVASSAGTLGSQQFALLAEQLISCAAHRCEGRLTVDGDELFVALDQVIDELRVLVKGRVVDVPATVGLSGLQLAADEELVTALGVLRPAPPARGARLPGTSDPDVLLTVNFPLRYTLIESDPVGPPPGYWDSWRTFEERIDLVRLAFLLARGSATTDTLRTVGEQVHDPLFPGGRRARFVSAPFAVALDVGVEPVATAWAERIHRHYRTEIALAVRRTLSAADPLREPDDALVDGVIALESLFGTGKSEVGFRLQTALAFLLGASEEERRTIHKEVGELYDARSNVVHGSGGPSREHVLELRQRAVELAVRSMRLLFSTHHGLIPNQARGKRIILAAGQGLEDADGD